MMGVLLGVYIASFLLLPLITAVLIYVVRDDNRSVKWFQLFVFSLLPLVNTVSVGAVVWVIMHDTETLRYLKLKFIKAKRHHIRLLQKKKYNLLNIRKRLNNQKAFEENLKL